MESASLPAHVKVWLASVCVTRECLSGPPLLGGMPCADTHLQTVRSIPDTNKDIYIRALIVDHDLVIDCGYPLHLG
eukprot:SAG11_NODE_473_length_9186_cov_2.540332_2_plen_76_part_00